LTNFCIQDEKFILDSKNFKKPTSIYIDKYQVNLKKYSQMKSIIDLEEEKVFCIFIGVVKLRITFGRISR